MGTMEIGYLVCLLVIRISASNNSRLIPIMGFCYMMQYMDKLAMSQASMLNLREDLVSSHG